MEIYFWFRKSTTSNLHGSLSCVIRIDGIESVPFSTKIKTEKKNWNAKSQCFEGKGSATKEHAKESLISRLFQIHRELLSEKNGEQIFPDDVRIRHIELSEKTQKTPSGFVDVLNKYLENQTKLAKSGAMEMNTIKTYGVKINCITKFLKSINKSKISCKDFDDYMADAFEHHLLIAGRKQSYINSCIIIIATAQKFAHKKRWINTKPLDGYKCKVVKKETPVVLEPLEIQKIQNYKFEYPLERVADAWLFCQETSLAFSDYMGLLNDMISMDEQGHYWIEKKRKKTDELQVIPLSEKALEIISKYGGTLEQLPRFCAATACQSLKKILKLVGITKKNVTWHTSRKSWANNSLNYKEMSDVTIAKVMGWSSTAQLKIYARINKTAISRQFFK